MKPVATKQALLTALESLNCAVRSVYGDRLVSCAIFGSVARGTATPESDIDLLIVATDLPDGRMRRVREFEEVERAFELCSPTKDRVLSPVIKTPLEARAGSPLYWDMTEDVLILSDCDDFLGKIIDSTREKLQALGATKERRGSAWYWILKKPFTPGEVFEI